MITIKPEFRWVELKHDEFGPIGEHCLCGDNVVAEVLISRNALGIQTHKEVFVMGNWLTRVPAESDSLRLYVEQQAKSWISKLELHVAH